MKFTYDKATDDAYIKFSPKSVVDSIEIEEDIVFDLDENDEVIGVEILSLKNKTPEQLRNIYRYSEYPIKNEDIQELKDIFSRFILCGV